MIAVLGGLGAALAWATTMICGTRAARLIGAPSVLAWVMLTGLVVTLPWALIQGVPEVDGRVTLWLTLAGAGNCAGLLLVYTGVRIGKVGVVAPIASTEGAIAALIAVAAVRAACIRYRRRTRPGRRRDRSGRCRSRFAEFGFQDQ
ncbi:MAG: EamA family transporter [Gaiellaceae bacterium]